MVRLSSGWAGSFTTASHAARSMVPVELFPLLKAGVETMAKTSPFRGSIDHHRPRAALHGPLGRLLDPAIEGGDHLGAGQGLGALAEQAESAAEGVHLDALAPVLAPQVFVKEPLQARLPHHVAPPVTALAKLLLSLTSRT